MSFGPTLRRFAERVGRGRVLLALFGPALLEERPSLFRLSIAVFFPACFNPLRIAEPAPCLLFKMLSTTPGAALTVSVSIFLAAGIKKRATEDNIPPPR